MSCAVLCVSPHVSLASKEIVPKALELLASQRLRKKISGHVVGSPVFDLRISLLNLIGYKEVTGVGLGQGIQGQGGKASRDQSRRFLVV
jgi:hypothetical protein